MYVYLESEKHSLFTVGFYKPDGEWEPESDHGTREEAAKRVHYLNGGKDEAEGDECSRKECTYYSHYLVHHDPERNGPRLEHEAYHHAEKRCDEAQTRVSQWYDAHLNDDRHSPIPEGLEKQAEFWEKRVCA